jgi:molecular chaperone GrpE
MPEERQTPEKSTESDEASLQMDPQTAESDLQKSCGEDELKLIQNRYLRLAAEFENYKKRAQKDQEEYRRYAQEQLLRELLPVLDNLQRALQHARQSGNMDSVLQGVELTSKQYLEILNRFGVKPIQSVGMPFDPAIHQAVATVPPKRGQKPNTIVDEYEKGYYLHDRVLRPAMVTVTAARSEQHEDHHDRDTA